MNNGANKCSIVATKSTIGAAVTISTNNSGNFSESKIG
ncbi:hypothetical protein CDAR_436141, partial [Caerostris darwini]